MEVEGSVLETIFDNDKIRESSDVDMEDVEEGEIAGPEQMMELQHCSDLSNVPKFESTNKKLGSRAAKKKKKKRKGQGTQVTNINRFVIDACRRLKEKKSYMIYSAVGCLGVSAFTELLKEVETIQCCGGQMTADGRRPRTGGGILWNIVKTKEPTAYKEITRQAKDFEKQFKQNIVPLRQKDRHGSLCDSEQPASVHNRGSCADTATSLAANASMYEVESATSRASVHSRIRQSVSYDDLLVNGSTSI